MKIKELIAELKSLSYWTRERTCDIVIGGNVENEIKKVGVCMFPTTDVIKKAIELGVNFLIAHEGLIYTKVGDEPHHTGKEKLSLLDKGDITVFRFHDLAHTMIPDLIFEGGVRMLGLKGEIDCDFTHGGVFPTNRFILDEPITARELAKIIEKNYNVPHVRIAGELDKKGSKIACFFGSGGFVMKELEKVDFVLTGELCEFRDAELARDYAEQGYNKAIIVIGHAGSEYAGMKLLEEKLKAKYTEFPIHYIECGDSYTFSDLPSDSNCISGPRVKE
ncbi:MAG: Nif3-like dinuclear metal center hexameric protein [Clostridia bacterium]|nr:Nif3-like dinuclear metal center hexameric protein [Clostridia bacterium]